MKNQSSLMIVIFSIASLIVQSSSVNPSHSQRSELDRSPHVLPALANIVLVNATMQFERQMKLNMSTNWDNEHRY